MLFNYSLNQNKSSLSQAINKFYTGNKWYFFIAVASICLLALGQSFAALFTALLGFAATFTYAAWMATPDLDFISTFDFNLQDVINDLEGR